MYKAEESCKVALMDAQLKKEWVAALRSGKYKHGVGRLHRVGWEEDAPDEFCCLGVLCEVMGVEPISTEQGMSFAYGKERCTCTLSYEIVKQSKLEGEVVGTTVQRKLTSMNDRGVKTFVNIADWIEANL